MNEAAARQVLLVQAFDSTRPASPSWSDEDSAWATRLAVQDAATAKADPGRFLADRAAHALQRLAPREPLAAAWLGGPGWRAWWLVFAVLAGLVFGLLADAIGSSQRINLLAPPLWAILVWNLGVYGLLIVHAASALITQRSPSARAGWWARATQRLLRWRHRLPRRSARGASAAAWQAFAGRWWTISRPLCAARVATLLHAAAAALAAGLIAGLYLRGLVLDYRAAWESTFLSAGSARAALLLLLSPAVALSGIALPDLAGFEALREAHGSAADGAPAAPWIHLFALTLLLFVLLPRSALALGCGLRAMWLARHVALPLDEPYFQGLLRQRGGTAAIVAVRPYAATPDAQAALALRTLLTCAFGDTMELQLAATVAFGAEDDAASVKGLAADCSAVVALFDLAATPEAENQGRFVERLVEHSGSAASVIMMVDEAAFVRRFGNTGPRLAQRREAWRELAGTLTTTPVFVDLAAPDLVAAAQHLQRALGAPAAVRSGSAR